MNRPINAPNNSISSIYATNHLTNQSINQSTDRSSTKQSPRTTFELNYCNQTFCIIRPRNVTVLLCHTATYNTAAAAAAAQEHDSAPIGAGPTGWIASRHLLCLSCVSMCRYFPYSLNQSSCSIIIVGCLGTNATKNAVITIDYHHHRRAEDSQNEERRIEWNGSNISII